MKKDNFLNLIEGFSSYSFINLWVIVRADTVWPHINCKSVWPIFHVSVILVGWSGGAMVLDKLPVPGRPSVSITVGQWPIALAVG